MTHDRTITQRLETIEAKLETILAILLRSDRSPRSSDGWHATTRVEVASTSASDVITLTRRIHWLFGTIDRLAMIIDRYERGEVASVPVPPCLADFAALVRNFPPASDPLESWTDVGDGYFVLTAMIDWLDDQAGDYEIISTGGDNCEVKIVFDDPGDAIAFKNAWM